MTTLLVTAQTYENYSDTETPFWKPKGSQMFSLNIDCDYWMYGKDNCIAVINDMLKAQSNEHMKFEYIDAELIFFGIKKLDDAQFESQYDIHVQNSLK